jgi:hypothetical protein
MSYFWLALGFVMLAVLAYRGSRIWRDAVRLGLDTVHRVRWTLCGAIVPSCYWWQARLRALPSEERAELLARETAALSLSSVDSLRCPLCEAEVPRAWAIGANDKPTIAPGPIECPNCDFRLDACRHCAHFLPGSPSVWGQTAWNRADVTHGRCDHYKTWQPIEQATAPDMARRLRDRGFERVRAPMPVMDSLLPPEHCRAYEPDRKGLRAGGIEWPDTRRRGLLGLLAPSSTQDSRQDQPLPSDHEQWLL